jgi:hypothetical protein
VVNKNKKLKQKNVLNNDDGTAIPKKRKMDNEEEKSSRKMDNININVKKHNEEITSIRKHETAKKKKRKNSQLNTIKNRKSGNAHSMMSLNVKRLKTYGISAKKINLLKHNKEF